MQKQNSPCLIELQLSILLKTAKHSFANMLSP